MKPSFLAIALCSAATGATLVESAPVEIKEWPVPWQNSRPRDPYVAPDGKVWFVGQTADYVAYLVPETGEFKRFPLDSGAGPHNQIVDKDGFVWYAGNRVAHIGMLDPSTGKITKYNMPDSIPRDPHTLAFDGKGNIWFSSQGASRIGRFNMTTGQVEIVNPLGATRANPYGLDLDPQGRLFVSLFATDKIAMVNPDMTVKLFPTVEGGRVRRNAVTPDGMVWYVDYQRGYVGRLDPKTGQTKEWMSPGGAQSRPYAITADGNGRLWVSETGAEKKLVAFDPRTEKFFANITVSHNIRHMMFDPKSGTMWFGTDANTIGRVGTRQIAQ